MKINTQWLTSGEQSVTISARTESGAVVSLIVSTIASPVAALLKSTPSELPPNALSIGNVYLPDATGAPLIAG
ncbi:hypothetical protein [Kozakia baliensis]|uniref:hypothetical protein n=1 Tax=Kozakia baliensis TaxID=153496 RepID=UPI0004951542|nr:hypothetical protein [Kozakia baliensis]